MCDLTSLSFYKSITSVFKGVQIFASNLKKKVIKLLHSQRGQSSEMNGNTLLPVIPLKKYVYHCVLFLNTSVI